MELRKACMTTTLAKQQSNFSKTKDIPFYYLPKWKKKKKNHLFISPKQHKRQQIDEIHNE